MEGAGSAATAAKAEKRMPASLSLDPSLRRIQRQACNGAIAMVNVVRDCYGPAPTTSGRSTEPQMPSEFDLPTQQAMEAQHATPQSSTRCEMKEKERTAGRRDHLRNEDVGNKDREGSLALAASESIASVP